MLFRPFPILLSACALAVLLPAQEVKVKPVANPETLGQELVFEVYGNWKIQSEAMAIKELTNKGLEPTAEAVRGKKIAFARRSLSVMAFRDYLEYRDGAKFNTSPTNHGISRVQSTSGGAVDRNALKPAGEQIFENGLIIQRYTAAAPAVASLPGNKSYEVEVDLPGTQADLVRLQRTAVMKAVHAAAKAEATAQKRDSEGPLAGTTVRVSTLSSEVTADRYKARVGVSLVLDP